MRLPNPGKVASREDFVAFIADLRASLDFALSQPMPPDFVDLRGGWINWANPWQFQEAMTACLDDSRITDLVAASEFGKFVLEPVEVPSEGQWLDGNGLRSWLQSIEAYAANETRPTDWALMAMAFHCGVTYE